jgi:hypothetical protein
MGRPLAQQKQERRLGEPFDASENAPAAAVVATGAGASPSHDLATCKRHM